MDSFQHTVDTAKMGQPDYQTCWHASFRMMYIYWGKNTNEIEPRLTGVGVNVPESKRKGLADTDYLKSAGALGLKSWPGRTFSTVPYYHIAGHTEGAEAFLRELQVGPLWVSRVAGPGYHATVAVGYNERDDKIIFHNPFPGPEDALVQRLGTNTYVKYITAAAGSVQAWRYTIPD